MFLIVNPRSGRGKGRKILPLVLKPLRDKRIPHDWTFTQEPGEATELAYQAFRRGFDKVIAVGGDGTVNEVIQKLVNTDIVVGIICAGVGCDIARSLGIPLDPKKAADLACTGNALKVDVGRVSSGQSFSRYFLNVLGVGFDAQVAKVAQNTERFRGSLAYAYGVLKEIFSSQGKSLTVETPHSQYQDSCLVLIAGNGRSEGRYFQVTPRAQMDDSLLDVCIIEDMPWWQRVVYLLRGLKGRHLDLPKVHYQRISNFKTLVPSGWVVHLDGEVIDLTDKELAIEVLPKSLKIIPGSCPKVLRD